MKTLFDDYLDILKQAREDDWYNEIEWLPGVNALTEHRREKHLSAWRRGKEHRPFHQRTPAPRMDWTK